jgi:hypothetical protein
MDGGMGTMIQSYKLQEEDFRGMFIYYVLQVCGVSYVHVAHCSLSHIYLMLGTCARGVITVVSLSVTTLLPVQDICATKLTYQPILRQTPSVFN